MKNICLFLFLLPVTMSLGQTGFKLNILSQLDYSISKKFHREYRFDSTKFNYKAPLGYSLDLGFELSQSSSHAVALGVRYTKKNFYPDLEIIFWYGGWISHKGDTLASYTPHLTNLQYELISIPITHKYYFKKSDRFSYYLLTGITAGFMLSQTETYVEDVMIDLTTEWNGKIVAKDHRLKLFNTAIEIGGGMNFRIKKDLNLLLQANVHFLDFRKATEYVAEVWPSPGLGKQYWWDDSFLLFGQFSLGLGIQKTFGSIR